jgi:hypothetical protein
MSYPLLNAHLLWFILPVKLNKIGLTKSVREVRVPPSWDESDTPLWGVAGAHPCPYLPCHIILRQFWDDFGTILGTILGQFWVRFWAYFEDDFGPILEIILLRFWGQFFYDFESILRPILGLFWRQSWADFGMILRQFWDNFETMLE